MTDYSKQLSYIAKTENDEELRNLINRARIHNAKPVEDAAFLKLISLGIEYPRGSVEYDFWKTVNAFEVTLKQERGKTVRLSRTRQKVSRDGVLKTLADWATGTPTEGFSMLIERDMPELLGEAIVLRHLDSFDISVVQAARNRLTDAGVDLDRVMSN